VWYNISVKRTEREVNKMASAYTPYKIADGRVVNVPNAEVAKLQAQLKLSRSEAVELWLFDHDYIENAEEQELTAKAKENKIQHKAKSTEPKQKTQRERVVKEDKVKEDIIQAVADMLPTLNAENVVIEKKGKLITFTVGEDKFKFDLIRQRPPKESKG
jgi:ribosomal protein L13